MVKSVNNNLAAVCPKVVVFGDTFRSQLANCGGHHQPGRVKPFFFTFRGDRSGHYGCASLGFDPGAGVGMALPSEAFCYTSQLCFLFDPMVSSSRFFWDRSRRFIDLTRLLSLGFE